VAKPPAGKVLCDDVSGRDSGEGGAGGEKLYKKRVWPWESRYSPEIRRAIYTTNAWETKFPLSR
jgi:hypothetical protein